MFRKKVGKLLDEELDLVELPKNILTWIEVARPMVAGNLREFRLEPFWPFVLEDNHPNLMCVNGRQTHKTTSATDIIGWLATTNSNVEIGYVVDNNTRKLSFSRQRLRNETFLQNPKLALYLHHNQASIDLISLLNGSSIYCTNDESGYKNIEGKSLAGLIFDEWQYHDQITSIPKAMYTLFRTHGRFWGFGIGGEGGSEYHKMWLRTDQREWIYKYNGTYQGWPGQAWREYLKFDDKGNIVNENLAEVLAGRWSPQRPENTEFRGYHMPQTIFAAIPLTIKDAVEKYHINPSFSIEWQRNKVSQSIYLSHVLGEFFKAERRPITPEMVHACMHPYRHLSLMTGKEVTELKLQRKNEIRILMGVDWGSRPTASSTVVSIMIKEKKHETYRLVWIEKRPQEHQLDQVAYMAQLARDYSVDAGVGDLGYGAIQIKLMQDGGHDSQGNKFDGLGRRKFIECRTIGDETKPTLEYKTEIDEHGERIGRLQIDKTTAIQKFVDFLGWYVEHPDVTDGITKRPKFIIPFKFDYETEWLVNDFCSVTRKDLEKDPQIIKDDPRQVARKEFNHPPDSMMACIYCLVADENFDEDAFRIMRIKRRYY
jgi:hypothetical protein